MRGTHNLHKQKITFWSSDPLIVCKPAALVLYFSYSNKVSIRLKLPFENQLLDNYCFISLKEMIIISDFHILNE